MRYPEESELLLETYHLNGSPVDLGMWGKVPSLKSKEAHTGLPLQSFWTAVGHARLDSILWQPLGAAPHLDEGL